jgi:hypothetical protein
MIAAPVQCDVDGVAKGSHSARVPALSAIRPGYLRSGIGSALHPSSVVTTSFLSRAHPKEASMQGNRGSGVAQHHLRRARPLISDPLQEQTTRRRFSSWPHQSPTSPTWAGEPAHPCGRTSARSGWSPPLLRQAGPELEDWFGAEPRGPGGVGRGRVGVPPSEAESTAPACRRERPWPSCAPSADT